MTSTGEMIAWFLDNNDITLNQLASVSGLKTKTVYRLIHEGTKLTDQIALGLHELLPGIKPEDIVAYDARFHAEKNEQELNSYLSLNEVVCNAYKREDCLYLERRRINHKTWNDYKNHVSIVDSEATKVIKEAEEIATIISDKVEQKNLTHPETTKTESGEDKSCTKRHQ